MENPALPMKIEMAGERNSEDFADSTLALLDYRVLANNSSFVIDAIELGVGLPSHKIEAKRFARDRPKKLFIPDVPAFNTQSGRWPEVNPFRARAHTKNGGSLRSHHRH